MTAPSMNAPQNTSDLQNSPDLKERPTLSALAPLLPFALRYKGRMGAALIALVMASVQRLSFRSRSDA